METQKDIERQHSRFAELGCTDLHSRSFLSFGNLIVSGASAISAPLGVRKCDHGKVETIITVMRPGAAT